MRSQIGTSATGTKVKRSPRELVQLLMTHSAEAFDSEQNVACTSSGRIIKLGNKPKNPQPSPVSGTHSADTEIPFGKNPLRRSSLDRRPPLISKKINEAASVSANFARARLISLL